MTHCTANIPQDFVGRVHPGPPSRRVLVCVEPEGHDPDDHKFIIDQWNLMARVPQKTIDKMEGIYYYD